MNFEINFNELEFQKKINDQSQQPRLEIIKAFNQGKAGNCVTIAIIKAAIDIFGFNRVFSYSDNSNGSFNVNMKDGYSLDLTTDEIKKAGKGSRFDKQDDDSIYTYAQFCFAAMAKRAYLEGNDQGDASVSFEAAIKSLNNGEYYLHGPLWLGLKFHYINIQRSDILHYTGVIGASKKHCFYVTYSWEDKYGTPDRITREESINRNLYFYRLTKDRRN